MKHLLLITPGFAADEADSQCIPPLQLYVRKLAERQEINISILALHYPHRMDEQRWHGVPIYSCHSTGSFRKLKAWRNAYRWLYSIQRHRPIDGIHSFWLNDSSLLGRRFSRKLKVPHWTTLMGQDARSSNRYLKWLPVDKLYTIALSPFHNETLRETTQQQADVIIPWGLDPEELQEEEGEKEIDLLGVGNLIQLKDYELFVRLVAQLVASGQAVKAVIIGKGPERSYLENLAEELGIAKYLQFTGAMARGAVLEYMRRSKVLLHTSTYESFGYVFLEALANEMQIVSRPVGIAPQLEYCQTGHSPEELLQYLQSALVSASPARSLLPYSIDRTVDQYLALYNMAW